MHRNARKKIIKRCFYGKHDLGEQSKDLRQFTCQSLGNFFTHRNRINLKELNTYPRHSKNCLTWRNFQGQPKKCKGTEMTAFTLRQHFKGLTLFISFQGVFFSIHVFCTTFFVTYIPVWMSIRKNELELDYQNAFVKLEGKAKCNHKEN